MQLVPFRNTWTGSETKLDLKAIYRRPAPTGVSLTGPIPLRRHKDWARKGFTYVCLATLGDLGEVAAELRAEGLDPLAMRECFDRRTGEFLVDAYLGNHALVEASRLSDLQAKVDKYGAEAVVDLMRLQDPTFTLPDGMTRGGKRAKAEPASA